MDSDDGLKDRVEMLELALKSLSDRLAAVELPAEKAWREDHEDWHAEHAQRHVNHEKWWATVVTHQRAAGRALTEIPFLDEEDES